MSEPTISARREVRRKGGFRFALATAIQGPGQTGCFFVYGFNNKEDILDFIEEGKNFLLGDSQICGFIIKLKEPESHEYKR